MPVGAHEALPAVFDAMFTLQPTSVLDLGIGYGFWGACCRNYFGTDWVTGAIVPHTHFELVGIECWEKYRNPMWDLYDRVIVGRIEEHLPLVGKADLVVAIDVLEHLPEEMSRQILRDAKRCVVGLPVEQTQGTVYGNRDETHRSFWTPAKLAECVAKVTHMPAFNPMANPGADYMIGVK